MEVCVDEKTIPRIGFGPDHMHGSPDDAGIDEILDTLVGVLADRIVLIEDVGGDQPGFGKWLDLRVAGAESPILSRNSQG